MKRCRITAVICGCLLIGSLYPGMLLRHHLELVDQNGQVIEMEKEINREIPLKVEFRLWKIFREND